METISFEQDIVNVNDIIRFVITTAAFDKICGELHKQGRTYNLPGYAAEQLKKLSGMKALRISQGKARNSSLFYRIHTLIGVFSCVEDTKNNNGFIISNFFPANLDSQNQAIRSGFTFKANGGISVKITLNNGLGRGIFCLYINGRENQLTGYKRETDFLSDEKGERAKKQIVSFLKEKSSEQETNLKAKQPDKESEITPQTEYFRELLQTSEKYSVLSYQMEEQKCHDAGRMPYKSFSASGYTRTDRTAYVFSVYSIDTSMFKVGSQVEFNSTADERISGEIIEIVEKEPEGADVTVLFNRETDLKKLRDADWIFLSFSSVIRDVQLDANSKLADGSAKAAYAEKVLGGSITEGFENKDLTQLRKELSKQKYPPNKSQLTAIEKGINTKDVFLVMGPPGTGKTTVIGEWVKYFVNQEHKRVLISSQNNKAVDNVLERLASEDLDMIRIGSEARLQENVIPFMFENRLKELNSSIDKATKDVSKRLSDAIRQWKAFSAVLSDTADRLTAMEGLKKGLRSNLERYALPQLQTIHRLHEEYSERQKEVQKTSAAIEKCNLWLLKYQSRSAFGQTITKPIFSYKRRKAASLSKKYKELEALMQKSKAELTMQQRKYHRYLDELKNRFTTDYSKAQSEFLNGKAVFENAVPEVPHISALFEFVGIQKEHIKSVQYLHKTIKAIQNDIPRAEKILQCETEWRKEIVGTQNYALNELLLDSVQLVGATCIGINSQKRFSNLDFDVTVIDEAGQIQIHNALVPMSVSNKLIMLGDHKQIPPSVDAELSALCASNDVDTELLEKSLFEYMFDSLPERNKIMLDTQYRMPSEIADIISEWFYNGNYHSAAFKHGLKSLLPVISQKPLIIIDTSKAPERYERRTDAGGTYNILEARICFEIMRHIKNSGSDLSYENIGIISAYKEQVGRIRKAISAVIPADNAVQTVATLDSFQGQERDLIIYSFTRSANKRPEQRRIGFLNELRRLNVAMSRCKATLILIGDMKFLSECEFQERDDDNRPVYAGSEKEFSDFIKKMLKAVRSGKGEIIEYTQLKERLGVK